MNDRLPPPIDTEELPPCIGARLRDEAAAYAVRQRQLADEEESRE